MQRIVVVGGGVAGHSAALELARLAPGSGIDLLSAEPTLPYDRPTLSKEILHRSKSADEIVLAGADGYAAGGVSFHPGTHVAGIDRAHRTVNTDDGRVFRYDRLLLATGSRPRRLPEAVAGDALVHYVRTIEDSLRLEASLEAGRRIAIIGGGFVGLEVAAAAVRRGCQVTVLEAQPQLLARSMPGVVSTWVARLHASHGVDTRLSTSVQSLRRQGGAVVLSGPDWTVDADLVVAGIGIVPNIELAAAAGLAVDDGVVVDRQCRTSDPAIYAAGEVTSRPLRWGGSRRVESWRSSAEQGVAAARALLGSSDSFDDVPTLWSDQYDANIQSVGFPEHAAQQEVVGDPGSDAWTWVALDDAGVVIGGVAINRGRDASALKRAVKQRAGMAFLTSRSSKAA